MFDNIRESSIDRARKKLSIRMGIAGATGAVGRILCEQLPQAALEVSELRLLASPRSAGMEIPVGSDTHSVAVLSPETVAGLDLLIASTPDDVASEIYAWCQSAGVTMIDESGAHRMLDHVPLVIPEVNPQAVLHHQGLLASPNCSTTQMVLCLKPLHDYAQVKRVIVSTYQAANGAGAAAESELLAGTEAALAGREIKNEKFVKPLAFNVLPQIGRSLTDGYTSEEAKMSNETRKILDSDRIEVCATCVRVPVISGHCESLVVECSQEIDATAARRIFAEFPGIHVIDDLESSEFPTPRESTGKNDVFVGRIRDDVTCKNSIAFWCVSDNLRKGAATNALQIAELLVEQNLVKPARLV